MRRILTLGLFAVVLLTACATSATDQQATDDGQSTLITVYRSPT